MMLSSALKGNAQRNKLISFARNRTHHVLSKSGTSLSQPSAASALSTFHLSNEKFHLLDQQRHMGRKDGNKAFFKTRGPTPKQRKKYHKRMRDTYQQKEGRHSKPGSKAGPRREYFRDQKEYLIDRALGKIPSESSPEELEYDFGDALIDDLLGNSAHLSASPTPKPVYLGHQYGKHHSKVLSMMDEFHAHLELAKSTEGGDMNALAPPLPTDKQISMLLRSYRDRNSNRSRPLGIVKALRHLLTEIRIPTSVFGDRTYAAVMSCAASPIEARRIMKMMNDNGQPPDVYIYSILIDIHAKKGDFRGANEVLSEMRFEGIEPTLPAYTSLLAACYKVINTASMPQKIKAEAGSLAWDKWKEARINGLKPDVMAYGSIIRIMAARGFPEKAINLIEEMQMSEVQPTTLIFSSALKAVSRSHANALRFEGGRSKKNKRREKIAAHHGKMTKNIVVIAEQANVEQDDGFISALMLCAGTAGDIATAKAIYLASEVQKLEDMRKIGGADHLDMIRGKNRTETDHDIEALGTGTEHLLLRETEEQMGEEQKSIIPKEEIASKPPLLCYDPQKRRRDTRKLNALLTASANAVEKRGLGNVWAGRENKGYLCESSLRMIQMRETPTYVDKSIPGMTSTEAGLSGMVWDDEDVEKMGKRLRRKKFQGLVEDQGDMSIEDLDPSLYKLFVEDEDILFDEEQKEREGQDSVEQTFKFEGGSVDESDDIAPETDLGAENSGTNDQTMDKDDDRDIIDGLKDLGAGDIDETLFDQMLDDDGLEENLLDDIMAGEQLSEEEKTLLNEMMSEFENHEDGMENLEDAEYTFSNEVETNSESDQTGDKDIVSLDDSSLQLRDSMTKEIAMPTDADDLDMVLYGLPKSRINRVRDEFERTLGTPSMIRLVPMLRENMPEVVSRQWLVKKNLHNANVVMEMAKEDKVVDIHLMNSMLQVYAKSDKVDEALDFYDNEFKSMHKVSQWIDLIGSYLQIRRGPRHNIRYSQLPLYNVVILHV